MCSSEPLPTITILLGGRRQCGAVKDPLPQQHFCLPIGDSRHCQKNCCISKLIKNDHPTNHHSAGSFTILHKSRTSPAAAAESSAESRMVIDTTWSGLNVSGSRWCRSEINEHDTPNVAGIPKEGKFQRGEEWQEGSRKHVIWNPAFFFVVHCSIQLDYMPPGPSRSRLEIKKSLQNFG